jgi:hypothetical protein
MAMVHFISEPGMIIYAAAVAKTMHKDGTCNDNGGNDYFVQHGVRSKIRVYNAAGMDEVMD